MNNMGTRPIIQPTAPRGRGGVQNTRGRGGIVPQNVRGRMVTPGPGRGGQVAGRARGGPVVMGRGVQQRGRAVQSVPVARGVPMANRGRGVRQAQVGTRIGNPQTVRGPVLQSRGRGGVPLRGQPAQGVRAGTTMPVARGGARLTSSQGIQPARGRAAPMRGGRGTVLPMAPRAMVQRASPRMASPLRGAGRGASPMRGASPVIRGGRNATPLRGQFPVPASNPRGPIKGVSPVRGGIRQSAAPYPSPQMRGSVRGRGGLPQQNLMQFSNTKKKVSLELSDRQLQALKNLGIM